MFHYLLVSIVASDKSVIIQILVLLYMCACVLSSFSPVLLFVTPWTIARQAPLSMGFSRREYWSRLPCPPLGDLPTQGSNPGLLYLLYSQPGSLSLAPPGSPHLYVYTMSFFACFQGFI